jgi:hypothetical protein
MTYPPRPDPLPLSATLTPRTIPGSRVLGCTASVRAFRASVLTLALALGWRPGPAWAAPAGDWAALSRQQGAGWLELRQDHQAYRERLWQGSGGPGPDAAATLGRIERQEDLDRRALDQRQRQWLDDMNRRQRQAGGVEPAQAPALRLRIERAEAGERLRRDLRRRTLGPQPGMAPMTAPAPFRLR